jgi:hypothetical protein
MPIKLLTPFILSLLLFTGFKPVPAPVKQAVEYVYVCEGPKSVVYHRSENCSGLSHCSTKTYKVTLEEAIKMNRRPCKIEYK